ncbi:hypothetical protein [Cellulomonas chitinilytica]|uniref:hypothetical protein n=1 Tax=Cellulomonas chitinilytica TaxID=398759 RepID=UPI0019415E98|nr:hypothetical protein [Cellulomonas chitinilytica]
MAERVPAPAPGSLRGAGRRAAARATGPSPGPASGEPSELLRLQRLVGNASVSRLVNGATPVVVQRVEAYDKPAVDTQLNEVITIAGQAFDAYASTKKKDPDKAALATDVQTRLRAVVTKSKAASKSRMTGTLEGSGLLDATGGGAGLEIRADSTLDDSAVTVAHPDGIRITFGDTALTSATRFRSVIFHEFVHVLQSADQPDELRTEEGDMWVHNLETVEGPDREQYLSLGTTPFDTAKVKSLDDKITDHPGFALNDALREIQAYSYELRYAAQTGITAGGAKTYREETVRNLNRYVDAVQSALYQLRTVRADTVTADYWTGYVAKAKALVLTAKKAYPDVYTPKF